MRLFKFFLALVVLFLSFTISKGQDSNTVNYSLFLEKSVSFGTLDTKIVEGSFKEGQSFIIPEANLTSIFADYQELFDALVGGRFGIDYGALNNDIIMKIFIRNLNPNFGQYLNLGAEEDTLFSYFEIRIWELPDSNFYPEDSSYYFNEGYYANFSLPKSDELLNFLGLVGINSQDSLAFAYLENGNVATEDWNSYGIETIDNADSVKFKAIHLSRIGGGRKRIAENYYEPNTINSVNIDKLNGIPNEIGLNQNYPNPFNPSTKISYSIGEAGFVTLKVYDVLGKNVLTLVNETQSVGNYEVEFSSSEVNKQLPSGIYIYTLNNNNSTISKKMILMK